MPIYRCSARITYPGTGQPGYNIWHADVAGTAGAQSFIDYSGAVAQFYDDVSDILTAGTTVRIWDDVVDAESDPPVDGPVLTPVNVAGGAGAGLPDLICLVVTWLTNQRGSSFRGRTFLGPIGSGFMESNGTPNATAVSTVETAAQTFVASTTGTEDVADPVVYSRLLGVGTQITGARVRDRWSYLSSRRD